MSQIKPYPRTCRQFTDGSYADNGKWKYLLNKGFAQDPQHYVRAFLLLQQDMQELFSFVEPADQNLDTYSHRIQQLLTRCCIEVEANLTAILLENGYSKAPKDLKIRDYRTIEYSHKLSEYEVRIPGWSGKRSIRTPFSSWGSTPQGSLAWYQAYNKAKHDRHSNFKIATLEALTDAMCGLAALLSAQFWKEDYLPVDKGLSISSNYSYDTNDGLENGIGEFFRIKFPTSWSSSEQYHFDWAVLSQTSNPFDQFNHANFYV